MPSRSSKIWGEKNLQITLISCSENVLHTALNFKAIRSYTYTRHYYATLFVQQISLVKSQVGVKDYTRIISKQTLFTLMQ